MNGVEGRPQKLERILLVKDEEMMRGWAKTVLRAGGYHVITANDGEEAIGIFRVHHEQISLVISDLSLPGLDGIGVLRELRRIDPEVKFILASPPLESGQKRDALASGAIDFLQKPYAPGEMLEKIRRILNPQ